MNDQLKRYIGEYESARRQVRALVDGLNEKTFNLRPDPESWSVAECIDHLCVLGNLLLPRLDAGVQQARAKGWRSDGPFRYGSFSNMFIRMVSPLRTTGSRRGKAAAPLIYLPSSATHGVNALVTKFETLQNELIERAKAADGLDIARVRIVSPVSVLIRIRLGAWFEAIAAHQFRHIEQAKRTKEVVAGGPL